MSCTIEPASTAEVPGIGLYAETGLHAALKRLYAKPEARFEVRIGRKIVDVVNTDEFVEIQTRNLASIREKVLSLACLGPVRVVVPLHAERWIERQEPAITAALPSALPRRRSPVRRDVFHIFDELVHATALVASPNIAVDVVLVSVLEYRQKSAELKRGRQRDLVLRRELDRVIACHHFESAADWLELLPAELPPLFTASSLGTALGISAARARKILYTYERAGLLAEDGRIGREKACRRASTWSRAPTGDQA